MICMRTSLCAAVCAAGIQFAVIGSEQATAQIYYQQPVAAAPVYYAPPYPNYVVYSPSYLGWRSAGYYGGNWGPYYYDPATLSPYVSPTVIWPNMRYATPPMTRPYEYQW